MVFLYDEKSGNEILEIKNDQFSHLKARRVQVGDRIDVRNLKDGFNYIYEIREISRKNAILELVFKNSVLNLRHEFSIAWAVVEPSVIEKTLPSLNELGVGKIIFVYSEFSQKNVKLDFERFERILINSSQQCGRNSMIEFEVFDNMQDFLKKYKKVALIDFGGKSLDNLELDELLFVGPEGGFSQNERDMIKKSYGLNSNYILRSNSAILGVCSKILL